MWKRLKDYRWIGVLWSRHCLQNWCNHQMYKQVNRQLKHKGGIIHYTALKEPEIIKRRKKLETDLENLLDTERLKDFNVLLFARVQEIIFSLYYLHKGEVLKEKSKVTSNEKTNLANSDQKHQIFFTRRNKHLLEECISSAGDGWFLNTSPT